MGVHADFMRVSSLWYVTMGISRDLMVCAISWEEIPCNFSGHRELGTFAILNIIKSCLPDFFFCHVLDFLVWKTAVFSGGFEDVWKLFCQRLFQGFFYGFSKRFLKALCPTRSIAWRLNHGQERPAKTWRNEEIEQRSKPATSSLHTGWLIQFPSSWIVVILTILESITPELIVSNHQLTIIDQFISYIHVTSREFDS